MITFIRYREPEYEPGSPDGKKKYDLFALPEGLSMTQAVAKTLRPFFKKLDNIERVGVVRMKVKS